MKKMIAILGAGGKTTRIRDLKEHFLRLGQSVLVTTTTKMLREPDCVETLTEIREALLSSGYVMAGRFLPPENGIEKIGPLPDQVFRPALEKADIILVEADGARHHSVKIPNKTDICLPAETTDIEIIMGTFELGCPIGDVLHRPELLPSYGFHPSQPLTIELIDQIVQQCYIPVCRRQCPHASVTVYYSHKVKGQLLFQKAYLKHTF